MPTASKKPKRRPKNPSTFSNRRFHRIFTSALTFIETEANMHIPRRMNIYSPHLVFAYRIRRFDCPFSSFLKNRPDKSPQYKPRRSSTQRTFLKPRFTAPSSVHTTLDLLRSASSFSMARSVLRHLHISAGLYDVQSNVIFGSFLALKAGHFG
jgi:hypothetical protein